MIWKKLAGNQLDYRKCIQTQQIWRAEHYDTEPLALAMQVCAHNVSGSISCLALGSCGLDQGWTHKSSCVYQRIILHVYYAFWEPGICASVVASWL